MTTTTRRIFSAVLIAFTGFMLIPEIATEFPAERGVMDVIFALVIGTLSYLVLERGGRA